MKVKASPDDPQLREYWYKRRTKYGNSYWDKNSKLYKIAQNQNWKCPICCDHFFNGEELETHHIMQVKDGGKDDDNLIHLHKVCHRHIHSRTESLK